MKGTYPPSPSVVAGIDGSAPALNAALWAVDEAVSRDVPLRLVYAIDPARSAHAVVQDAAHRLATAEIAVRYALTAVESLEKPVKIEVEILQDDPVRALLDAARSAAMLCVGAGVRGPDGPGRIGPTAAALADLAHCPVAIVRECSTDAGTHRRVVAEVDDCGVNTAVLERAAAEARLRNAPLTVVTLWLSRFTDIHDPGAVDAGNRAAKARLDRELAPLRERYPDVRMVAKSVHGTTSNYLTANSDSVQLLVVDKDVARGFTNLVGSPGHAGLYDADYSVLICEPQHVT